MNRIIMEDRVADLCVAMKMASDEIADTVGEATGTRPNEENDNLLEGCSDSEVHSVLLLLEKQSEKMTAAVRSRLGRAV
jgi:hypothetical protein